MTLSLSPTAKTNQGTLKARYIIVRTTKNKKKRRKRDCATLNTEAIYFIYLFFFKGTEKIITESR